MADTNIEHGKPEENKKYIEVTQEDYETALASKVIQKSYKMILGVVLLIVSIFAIVGINFSIDINELKTELKNSKEKLEDRELSLRNTENDLKATIRQFENERKFTESFYKEISTSFGASSNSMFQNFVRTTKDNLTYLNKIEDKVSDEIKTAQEKTNSIQQEIKTARAELAESRADLTLITTTAAETKNQRDEIENLMTDFTSKFSFQPVVISVGKKKYSDLLKVDVSYNEGKWKRKSRRTVTIGNLSNTYDLDKVPKTFTKWGWHCL